MTDPIADMLTRIRNAVLVRQPAVLMPYSKHKLALAKILESEGFIARAEKVPGTFDQLRVVLKYADERPVIRSIRRISSPGRRVYLPYRKMPHILQDLGIAVVSTSRGLMTNKQARKERLGGEVLCEVY
jgi:small subunit ribosomal protein S8